MNTTKPILKTQHVSVIYNEGKANEFTALKDISLEIFPEEYVIFFGPSGSGKSTMLYTLLGLQKPSRGAVYVRDRDSATFTERERGAITSSFFGIVFQNFNLIYSLNVEDNVMLPQVFVDVPKADRRARAQKLLERFGIATRRRNLPNDLSGGQQQRVAICRALINDPQVLFADEPVGNLDSESAHTVMQTLSEINHKDKKTVVLVTHDASYLPYADRVFHFKDAELTKVVKNAHPVRIEDVPPEAAAETDTAAVRELEEAGGAPASLTLPALRAWTLTRFLSGELTTKQLRRLETCMGLLLKGDIALDDFQTCLRVSFAKGGVGLYAGTAARYARRTGEILSAVRALERQADGKANHAQKRALIRALRRFVLEDFYGDLSQSQIAHVEQAITARVHKELTDDQFVERLMLPNEKGGAHLRPVSAERLAEKLKVILASFDADYVHP